MIIRAKAPLRLGLAGGGTDISAYYSQYVGHVLNATIDMYAYCTIIPQDNGILEFFAADIGEKIVINNDEDLIQDDTKLKLHLGVYKRIIYEFNKGKSLSFKMVTYSDAPAGSGLGASSTIVVAMLKAYIEWLNLPLGEYEIAELAYQIERHDLGLAGGKQDQYSSTFGGFNFMEFYADEKVIVNPLRLKRWICNELENSLILYYTGISRESSNIIAQQIKSSKNNSVGIEGLHELKFLATKMKEALLRGNFHQFASCLAEGWEAKQKTAAVVSNDKIDELYKFIMKNGAMAAKISGAGGGGFFMI
jgi:D-glycero-alpha-D-manno-heptose-7-phosphate kinase